VSPKQKITNATKKSSIPKGIDTAAENGDGERTFSKAETIPSMDEKTTEDVLDNRPPHKDYFAALMDISWPPTMFVPSNSLMGRVAKWLRTNGYQPEEGEAIVEYVTEIAQKDEWTTRWHLTCVETFAADWQARVRDDSVLTPLLRKKLKLIGQDFSAPGLRKAIAEGWFDPAHEGFGFDLDGAIRDLGLEVPT
jgi:hypothetical protein